MNTKPANMHQMLEDDRLRDDLLAFWREELDDPTRYANIQDLIRKDERWKAHYESIRFLDLDRAAAIHDKEEIEELVSAWRSGDAKPTPFCHRMSIWFIVPSFFHNYTI